VASKGVKIGSLVAAAALVMPLAACGSDSSSDTVATVTQTVTAGATSTSTGAPPSSTSGPKSSAKLAASFDALTLSQPVGLAVVPVGGGDPLLFGDQTPQVAWSTIKVPLALAAERKNGPSSAESAAITASDNASAEALWASLGGGEQAAQAVTAVLREGGDTESTVPSQKLRGEFTIFGQTTWPLKNAATFTSNLPCLPGSRRLISLMGQVAGNQQWGVETIRAKSTAVKGGWGPSVTGGYVVRQIGLITKRDGSRIAVAMSTYSAGASMESGIAALNQAGSWVASHLASLPSGKCSSGR